MKLHVIGSLNLVQSLLRSGLVDWSGRTPRFTRPWSNQAGARPSNSRTSRLAGAAETMRLGRGMRARRASRTWRFRSPARGASSCTAFETYWWMIMAIPPG